MLRFILAVLFLAAAPAAAAQTPPAPAADTAQRVAEEKARADKAEQYLAIEQAAGRIEDAQTEQAYNRFEIWTGILMGAFSVLITLLVIMFGFRTEKAAAVAARQEVATAKAQIDALLAEAKQAADSAAAAQAQAEATKAAVDELLKQSSDATTTARANAEEAARHLETTRQSAAIIDGLKSNAADPNRDPPKLTPAQEEIVKEAASGTKGTPEAEWSVEEFKTRIGKAQYLDADWEETLRLSEIMARIHGSNDDAYTYARNAEGDALRALNRYRDAIIAYEAVGSRISPDQRAELDQLALWAQYHKGVCLTAVGNAAEAEALFRVALPLCERANGDEHPNTLATRHELVRAILDQGRVTEAEAEFRALLPLREKIDGIEHPNTLATRHSLARAILDQGGAAEAETEFRILLSIREKIDGNEHPNALATRHELARAILDQGGAAEAETEFRVLLPLFERMTGSEHSYTLATRHLLAIAMLEQGRAAEAEAELRTLLAIRESSLGSEHRNTLATRHTLASAILEQDRSVEAEAEFRALLSLYERTDDAERPETLVTRFLCAKAVLENGDAQGAKALLAPIQEQSGSFAWVERWSAALSFVRGEVADALGNPMEADDWLEKANAHYANIYPADHYRRRKLEAYRAGRRST